MPSRIKRLVCSMCNNDLAILMNLVFFGSPSVHTSVYLITYLISGDCHVSCNGSVIVKVILCLGGAAYARLAYVECQAVLKN